METKPLITVLIEARNEREHITECIASARLLTQSVVVIDQESTDGSEKTATDAGAHVYQHKPIRVVEEIREYGIRKVRTPWVFILDADERMSEELAQEIHSVIRDDSSQVTHYRVPRRNIFGGATWLRHGGWWPDTQLRLIRISAFRDWPTHIHSTPEIEGASATLQHPILHLFHGDITKMVEKTALFEDIESELLYKAGRASGTAIFFRKFLGELKRRLLQNAGYMDGAVGIIESLYQAYSKTITYLFLYEKQKSRAV